MMSPVVTSIGICWKIRQTGAESAEKAATLDIQTICPLHGPVLTENLGHYLSLYNTWSSYQPESEGIVILHFCIWSTKAGLGSTG